jgi:hypothetical protein
MSDIAIRVENCIQSGGRQPGVEGLSKHYPAVAPRACPECNEGARHLGRAQSRAGDSLRSQRHDTPSTRLRTRLRDALSSVFSRQSSVISRQSRLTTDNSELKTDNCELKTDNSLSSRASPSRPRAALRSTLGVRHKDCDDEQHPEDVCGILDL